MIGICTINNAYDLLTLCPQLDALCLKRKREDIWDFTLNILIKNYCPSPIFVLVLNYITLNNRSSNTNKAWIKTSFS